MLEIEWVEMEKKKEVYQCQSVATCAYIYNSKRGDKKGKVPPGTAFKELPDPSISAKTCSATETAFSSGAKREKPYGISPHAS